MKMYGARPFYSFTSNADSNRFAGVHASGLDFTTFSVARIELIDDHVVNIFLITDFRNILITITRANQSVVARARFGAEKAGFFENKHQVTRTACWYTDDFRRIVELNGAGVFGTAVGIHFVNIDSCLHTRKNRARIRLRLYLQVVFQVAVVGL